MRALPTLFFSMDASHPIARAVDILQGLILPWRGEAVCFHFGALQTWIFVPILAVSREMDDVMWINAVLHGLGVVPMAVAGQRVGGRVGAIVAAAFYACWPVLLLHPCQGAWTYHAPLFLAVATMAAAWALTGRSRSQIVILAAAMACAVHFHPYAIAPALGAALLIPRLLKINGWKPLVVAGVVAGVILAPMVVDNVQTVYGDRPNEGCSLVQTPGPILDLLLGAVLRAGMDWPTWAEVTVLLAPPCGLLILVTAGRARDAGRLIVPWAVASYAVAALVAKLLSYMAPYHAAVLVPVHSLALAWLVAAVSRSFGSRLWVRFGFEVVAMGVVLLAVVGAVRVSNDVLDAARPSGGQLQIVDKVGEAIHRHASSEQASIVLVNDHTVVRMGEVLIYNADLWLRRGRPPEAEVDLRYAAPAYAVMTLRDTTWTAWGDPEDILLEVTVRENATMKVVAYPDHKAALEGVRRLCDLRQDWPGLEVSDLSRSLAGLALAEDYVGGPASTQAEVLCRGGRRLDETEE